MSEADVFSFDNPREFLQATLHEKQKLNPRFSIRAWTRQLGLDHPSILARLIKGERTLKSPMAQKIADTLKLGGDARRYFELLVLFENAKTPLEKEVYQDMLGRLRPEGSFTSLTLDYFHVISDWYHLAILEMTQLRDFCPDPAWISARLGGGVPPALVRTAIERLLRLELLSKNSDGRLCRVPDGNLRIAAGAPDEAVRKYHRQMIEKALAAVEPVAVAARELRATTLGISKKNYKKACEIMSRFHAEISALAEKNGADEIYQLNTQFFPLTDKTNKNGKAGKS